MSELVPSQQAMPSSQSTAPALAPAKVGRKKSTIAAKFSETEKKIKKTVVTSATGQSKHEKSPTNHPQYIQMASQAIQVGVTSLPRFIWKLD